MPSRITTAFLRAVLTISCAGLGVSTNAQELSSAATQTRSAGRAPSQPMWEIELHGGGTFVGNPTSGTATTLPSAAPFTTIGGLASRRVSSWFFGDGAQLLNQLPSAFVSQRITPLDPLLDGATTERRSGGSAGFRVSRRLTSRYAAEVNFDYVKSPLEISDATMAGIEATRASFERTLGALVATTPIPSINGARASATSNATQRRGAQTITTGALVIDLAAGRLIPYVTLGAGVITGGDLPEATLTGTYQFQFFGIAPLSETDTVRLHYSSGNAFVGVLGGGVKRDVSTRWGVRGDARVNVSREHTRLLLDASPSSVIGTPAFSINSATSPSIQFTNNPATTASSSTLSGPALASVETFRGTGARAHVALSGGIYWRF